MYTMEWFSAITKTGIMAFAGKWMNLDIVMLSKVNQVHQDKGHMFSHSCQV
jgi:hypothetical protein